MHKLSNIYLTSYAVKMVNPKYTSKKICEMLEVDMHDLNQVHKVHLGVWKANKKLGITGGYTVRYE